MGTGLVFMPVVMHVSLRDADAIALKLKKWSSRENGDTPAGWLGEAKGKKLRTNGIVAAGNFNEVPRDSLLRNLIADSKGSDSL